MVSKSKIAPRIFLSYSHKDSEFGAKLVNDLRHVIGTENSVWYDEGIRVGDKWWAKIMRELSSSNIFLVILSPDALKSSYVQDEILTAYRRNAEKKMRFMPILYRPYKKVPPELAFLSNHQYISFLPSEDYEIAFKKLLKALKITITEDEVANKSENKSKKNYELRTQIQQALTCIKQAYDSRDWYSVITIADALTKYYTNFIPASVFEMKTFAYLYKHSETMNKERYALAQTHLKKVLSLVDDPRLRIELLDAYVITLMEQGMQEEELKACIEEARRLAPQDVSWKELQSKLLLLDLSEEQLRPKIKSKKVPISKKIAFPLISIVFLALPLFRHLIKRK